MECAEGRSPFAGSLRVSLRYNLVPLPGLARKGDREMVEGLFQHSASRNLPAVRSQHTGR